ncbi:hypothetical protein F511_29302 [Dorcoceras hygrometricum]|uniref:HMG box domain-containing protein n=1 Tax=Dorcoceras hygrometricum TaxID=472368 RepID=A0A2Z7C2M5_9LAMI|nr:hypothetical protein F511_29302 [Dorcoceras hygrometricum]
MKGGKSKAESKKGDSRLAVKKQTKKEKRAAKDPNKPKRPPSAFFVFMSVNDISGILLKLFIAILLVKNCNFYHNASYGNLSYNTWCREDFRKQYKEKHPNTKSVAVIGKAGGDKWKSMSDDEKAPFVEMAAQRKEEYERKMEAYNKKLAGGGDDDSDKSKSEINDEEDEEGSGEDEEDDD